MCFQQFFFIVILCLTGWTVKGQILWPEGKQAAVVLTYDDGLKSHLEIAIPQLEERGFRGTFYLFSQVLRIREIPVWRQVSERGHELGNHSLFHPCLTNPQTDKSSICRTLDCYTVSNMLEEVSMMNQLLYAMDGRGTYSYAYPCQHTTAGGEDYSQPLLASGLVKYARGGNRGIISDVSQIDLSKLPAVSHPDGEGADFLIHLIEEAKQKQGLLIIVFHGVGGEYITIPTEEHARLLDYLAQEKETIWVDTLMTVMDWVTSQ